MLRDIVLRALVRHGDRVALCMDDRELTYSELDVASTKLANALLARGVRTGDAVALLLRNGFDYPIADLAIVKLGAVKVPLNEMLAEPEAAYMLEHSGAKAVVAHASFGDMLGRLRTGASAHTWLIGDDAALPSGTWETFADAIGEASTTPVVAEVTSESPALVIYTGGTTGRSKGVVHTQQSLGINLLAHAVCSEIVPQDHVLLSTPLPHSAGFFLQTAMLQGAKTTLVRNFGADRILSIIAESHVTWTFMVPTMIYRMLDATSIDTCDHSSLRTIVYGAAPIAPTRLRQAIDTFGPIFLQLYGQSECPNFVTLLSKSDHLKPELRASCGQAVFATEVRIGDEAGNTLGPGEVGELQVRSPYTLERYHDAPESTAAAYLGDWLRTGDIAYELESGHVFLVDRAKDMIVSGGMNVYTTEVENALQECAGVRQAAVIGVPDDDWGEAVKAFVVPSDRPVSMEELIAFCRQRLAKYKVPKHIEAVAALPLTAFGKIDKKALREHYWGSGRQIH